MARFFAAILVSKGAPGFDRSFQAVIPTFVSQSITYKQFMILAVAPGHQAAGAPLKSPKLLKLDAQVNLQFTLDDCGIRPDNLFYLSR